MKSVSCKLKPLSTKIQSFNFTKKKHSLNLSNQERFLLKTKRDFICFTFPAFVVDWSPRLISVCVSWLLESIRWSNCFLFTINDSLEQQLESDRWSNYLFFTINRSPNFSAGNITNATERNKPCVHGDMIILIATFFFDQFWCPYI